MATKNIVPRTGSEGEIGTSSKPWSKAHIDEVTATQVSSSYLSASSDARVAGNSHFGSELTNTHIFTGSFHQTGSGATSTFKDQIITSGSMKVTGIAGTSEVFRVEGTGETNILSDGNIAVNAIGNDLTLTAGSTATIKGAEVFLNTNTAPGDVNAYGRLSASLGITASSFVGDGSGLSGIITSTPTLDQVTTAGSTTTNAVTVGQLTSSGDISGSANLYANKIAINNSLSGDYIQYANGFYYKGSGQFVGTLSASFFSASSGFVGDGSGLTGVTGDWDGQHTGDAGITGSLAIKSDTGLDMIGADGTSSGSLFHSGGGLLLGGQPSDVGILAPGAQAFMSNGAASLNVNGTDVNLTPNAAGKVAVAGVLSASLGITASSFVGDGSGLTGVTGDWDGQHTGAAAITGSLTIQDSDGLTIKATAGAPTIGTFANPGDTSLTITANQYLNINSTNGLTTTTSGDNKNTSRVFEIEGNNIAYDDIQLYLKPSTYSTHQRYLGIGYNNSTNTSVISAGKVGTGDNELAIWTSNSSSAEAERVRIDVSGNVGIGTTTPAHKLDVVGSAAVTGSLDIKSDTGLVMIGADGTSSGSLFHSGGGLILGGLPSDVGILAPGAQAFMSNGNASLNVNTTDVNLTPHASGKVAVAGVLSASLGITASSFVGDGSGLSGVVTSETDTLATVTARGASTTTPVLFNTHITASTGINSGPLHVAGASVHSGSIDMYSGGGLSLFGTDGTASGSLSHSGGGLVLAGTSLTDVGILAPGAQAFMSNGAASLNVNGADVNLTPDIAAGKVAIATKTEITGNLTVLGQVSSSLGITAGSVTTDNVVSSGGFTIGSAVITEGEFERLDGASSTVAANKVVIADGSKNVATLGTVGCGAITSTGASSLESVDVSGSATLGSLVTDTHIITGSTEIYTEAQTGLQVLQNVASSGYPVARFENTNAGGSTYIETHGVNQGGIKMYRGGTLRATIDTAGNAFTMYAGTPVPANLGFMIQSGKAEFKETTADNFTGTKGQVNISASSGPAIRIDSGATPQETTFKVEDYTTTMVSASADLLTMDDTNAPPTPSNAAHMYAKSGEMYVMDTAGNETQISPHGEDGEWQYFSRNTRTGKVVRIRMEKMIRKLEELTGETFIEEE